MTTVRLTRFLVLLTGGAALAACAGTPTGVPDAFDDGTGNLDATPTGTGATPTAGGAATVPTTPPTTAPTSAPTSAPPPPRPAMDFPGSTIELCPDAVPVSLPVDSFEPCEMVGCEMAHCVPEGAIPDSVPISLLGRCADPATVCVPDDYTATFGNFLAQTCHSILGAEGRCISTCIPQVNGLTDALPQDVCGANERCAPCVNPNDGTDTGACSQGCDPGASTGTVSSPIVFERCQDGGVCTPRDIIPDALLTHLVQYECEADEVCAPIEKAQNLKYNFAECVPSLASILAVPNDDGQIGGCVPAWVADANPFEGIFLAQDTCAVGEKCAPCNNPLRANQPTGACPIPLPSDPTGGLPPDGTL